MEKEDYNLIRYKYEIGVYTLIQLMKFVEMRWITKHQFHQITSYSYEGLKK